MVTVGVVGPHDLTASTCKVVEATPGVTPVALPYRAETQAADVVRDAPADVDVWLFTGVMPYEAAAAAGLLDRPAAYVAYSGATLLNAVIQLMRDGLDPSSFSIDILEAAQVEETLKEAGIGTAGVRVLPYRRGLTAADIVAFHRECAADGAGAAITCLRSAYGTLRNETTAIRLAPSIHSVRYALQQLLVAVGEARSGDAQVAVGLCEAPAGAEEDLRREAAGLGGTVVPAGDGRFLIFTTRGPLEAAAAGFTELPMVAQLGAAHGRIRLGFGVGATAAEAETLARRALGRAGSLERSAAVVSLRNDIDLTLSGAAARSQKRPSLSLLSERAGLSKATLVRLQEMLAAQDEPTVTTRSVAAALGVQQRTARRLLNRLERAGAARPTGRQGLEGSGRPLVTYRLHL
ncbi:hypothetical protein G5C51_06820 [Streptomyces sp. A7024]|uniref:Transcriptional regulator n=1 Tax=Streptomyces coryli TaxID=1128680 RepID=A0A6G4TUC0_9ACTN|nr:hypothetical protein [Streptomyces coryli]NGN63619.1 hypothetical protein [Streptomyces coryli]